MYQVSYIAPRGWGLPRQVESTRNDQIRPSVLHSCRGDLLTTLSAGGNALNASTKKHLQPDANNRGDEPGFDTYAVWSSVPYLRTFMTPGQCHSQQVETR